MLTANMSSSFANLTPVSNTASSSSTDAADDISQSVNCTNVQDFHRFVEELGFDEEPNDEIAIPDSPDGPEEEDSDDEKEDVKIKYPYERKDYYQGLEERIHQRLDADDSTEADNELWEVKQLLKEVKERHQPIGTVFTPGSVFTCVICAKAFSDADGLQEHTTKAHDLDSKKFKCNICGRGFARFKNLESHKKLHRKEFECNECSLVFQFAATLNTHKRKYHKKTVDLDDHTIEIKQCDRCKQRFPADSFYRHAWYCKNKEKVLAKKAEKRKQTQSVPPSPAMSTTSYASFTSLQPGPSYSPMVSPVVSYRDKSCQVCGEAFASRQSMLRHVGRKHPEAKNDPNVTAVRYVSTESPTHQYACQDCGKRLTSRAALTSHRARAHLDTDRNQCHLCDKSYTVPSELTKHIRRVHQGEAKPAKAQLPELDDIF